MKLAAVALMTAVTICCVPPLSTTAPAAAAPSALSDCSPQSDSGTCYQAGERCRNSDHGASGTDPDGRCIKCEDNDGWRWEPASC